MPVNDTAILNAAANAPLRNFDWKDRGLAPRGYIKGMAVAFAHASRDLKSGDGAVAVMAADVQALPDRDVLAWYRDVLDGVGLGAPSTPDERLLQLFAIMFGLGMRESSGKHCEGRDMSAHNVTADSAEAGLFQVSRDSINAHPQLQLLFDRFRNSNDLQQVFVERVECGDSSWQNWGEGAGKDFQALTKACPKFAVYYTAVLLRHLRKHWGPINRKEAEVVADAIVLLRTVKAFVNTE